MSDTDLKIDPKTTALVLIDLQNAVIGLPVGPHSAQTVVENSVKLAERFRTLDAPVVLVRVTFAPDRRDWPSAIVDRPPPTGGVRPDNWDQIIPELGPHPNDIIVTKRQWGAFYGTDLDLHLRRRGISTIVLAGIATNFGVESTARDAYERSYGIIFAEDATSAMTEEAHAFALATIFPRLGRIRSTDEILSRI